MNFYEHHLGDYMRNTAHLSMLEDGAYRRLLDAYYVRERPLPVDLRECCKLARASTKQERDAVAYVLREFFHLREDGYHQGRADDEVARYQAKQAKAKASAEARWARCERNANASPEHMQTQCERMPDDDASAMRTHVERMPNAYANGMPHARAPAARAATGARPSPVPSPQSPPMDAKHPRGGRGSRLPPDWEPGPEGMAFASEHGLVNGKAQAEAEKFRDYWTAATGRTASKADWDATWRNWVRKAGEFGPRQGHGPSESGTGREGFL